MQGSSTLWKKSCLQLHPSIQTVTFCLLIFRLFFSSLVLSSFASLLRLRLLSEEFEPWRRSSEFTQKTTHVLSGWVRYRMGAEDGWIHASKIEEGSRKKTNSCVVNMSNSPILLRWQRFCLSLLILFSMTSRRFFGFAQRKRAMRKREKETAHKGSVETLCT